MRDRGPYKFHYDDAPGRCYCTGYSSSVGILFGAFASIASLATGKPKENYFVCGSDLHEFIAVFQKQLAERGQEGIDDMPVYVEDIGEGSGEKFQPHPDGLHRAVCSQVIDLGMMPTQWGDKPKVDIKFQLADDNLRTDGKRFTIGRRYTKSLNKKSNLRKELELWRGKPFTAAELVEFLKPKPGEPGTGGLDRLIGTNCQLQLIHTEPTDDGRIYANIKVILPPAKGEPKLEVKVSDIPAPKDGPTVVQGVTADPVPF